MIDGWGDYLCSVDEFENKRRQKARRGLFIFIVDNWLLLHGDLDDDYYYCYYCYYCYYGIAVVGDYDDYVVVDDYYY